MIADRMNQDMGVTPEQEEALHVGVIFGWEPVMAGSLKDAAHKKWQTEMAQKYVLGMRGKKHGTQHKRLSRFKPAVG